MSTSSKQKTDDTPTPPDRSTVVLLLATAADTTWRMFIPIIGLTVLGLMIDKQLHTTPWLLIVGIMFGTALATALVHRQMKDIKQDTHE